MLIKKTSHHHIYICHETNAGAKHLEAKLCTLSDLNTIYKISDVQSQYVNLYYIYST